MTSICRIVMVGFGSVGRGFAQILRDRGEWITQQTGVKLQLVGVATRNGSRYDPQGLDPAALLNGELPESSKQPWSPTDMVANAEADLLVEVSSTNLDSGEPATSLIRAAFGRGWHVVTANKGPLALFGQQLLQEAHQAGVGFGFEGTVMSGTPSLRMAREALAGCEIREVRGIINGTTNYILTHMDAGQAYADALAEAQRLGYAETDPTGDVEGHDAAGKAVILANMLFGAQLRPTDVVTRGITGISTADVAAAQQAGERWKLIARIWREADHVYASVQPTRLPLSHPLAGVSGATNALSISTDLLGEVTVIGPGAGGIATGFAILSDIVAIYR